MNVNSGRHRKRSTRISTGADAPALHPFAGDAVGVDAFEKRVPFMGDAVAVACASAVNHMTLTHSMFTYPMPDTSSYCIVWDVCIPLEDVTIEQNAEVGQAWPLGWRNTACRR